MAVALSSAAPAAAATNPTVVNGTHAANIPIPTGPLTEMVSLPLPGGRWFVMAKAMVSGITDDFQTYSVNCRLSAGTDFDVAPVTPTPAGGPNSRLPIVLTVVHHFQAPGEAVLGCSSHVTDSAVIGLISVQAMKVGMLTNGPIGSLGGTSGTGNPRVISAFRDSVIFTDEDDWSPPQDLPLSQGRWLIVAKASVSGAASGNIVARIQCRVVGMTIAEFVSAGGLLLIQTSWRNPGVNPYAVEDARWGFVDDTGADYFTNEHAINVFSDQRLSPVPGFPDGSFAFFGSAGFGEGHRLGILSRVGRIVIDVTAKGELDHAAWHDLGLELLSLATERAQEALSAQGD